MNNVKYLQLSLIYLFAVLLFTYCGYKEDKYLPTFEEYLYGIRSELSQTDINEMKNIIGDVDSICIATQIRGGKGSLSEEELEGILRDELLSIVPSLAINKKYNSDKDHILFQLYLHKKDNDEYYGYSSIEFSRSAKLIKSNYQVRGVLWEDILPFYTTDPFAEINYLVKLQVMKFGGMWKIAREDY